LAAVGGIFFAGRTLVLRVLQALPGAPLSILRQHFMATAVSRWWLARQHKGQAEQRLTPLEWVASGDFVGDKNTPKVSAEGDVADALAASERARHQLERLAVLYDLGGWQPEPADIDVVVKGLRAFYSLPGLAQADPGTEERARLKVLMRDKPHVSEIVSRMRGQLLRELLDATAEAHEQPDDERWLAPTRLGNRVAALDDYAERRYGIGTSTLWIRLWGVLDDKEKREVTDAQLMVELFANLTAAFALLAVLILVSSAVSIGQHLLNGPLGANDWRALWFVAGSVTLALACYHTAVFAFGAVAERIIRFVDLQRLRLLTGVGYAPPKTVAEELEMFKELNDFFAGGSQRDSKRTLTAPAGGRTSSPASPRLGKITL
jgi:hypothetical protein